jgi:hypothetical protein
MPSVNANPLTPAVASTKRMNAVSSVMTLASMIVAMPRRYPCAIADRGDRPALASSLIRSNMTMLASAATPIVRTNPAIPGSVSVIGMSFTRAKKKTP